MDWVTVGFLDGLGTVGTWGLLGLALITGRGLALTREVKQRDKTIEWQRLTIVELNSLLRDSVNGNRVAAHALDKVSDAAVSASGEVP